MPSTRHRLSRAASILALVCTLFLTAGPLSAQITDLLGQKDTFGSRPTQEKIDLSARLVPDATAADVVTLEITARLPKGFYIYSTNLGFGGGTKISTQPTGLTPLEDGFRPDRAPKIVFEPFFKQNVEKFYDSVTWTRSYRLSGNPQSAAIKGTIEGQYCSEGDGGRCIRISPPHEFRADLAGAETVALTSPPAAPTADYQYEITPEQNAKPLPAHLSFDLSPIDAQPGERVMLSITAQVADGWHTYSLTQRDVGAVPTVIDVQRLAGLEPIGEDFRADKPFEFVTPIEGLELEEHTGRVTWSREYEVLAGADAGGYGISGQFTFQLCDERKCLLPATVPFALGVAAVERVSPAAEPSQESEVSPAVGAATDAESFTQEADRGMDLALVPFLITAFLAGFAALLTPCVFPMVPITVSFFLKQSEKEHHRPIWMAFVYCAGIVLTFTGLGLVVTAIFGATALNQLVNNPWLNLGIAAVLIFFGLNLLGMFELRVPGRLLTYTSGQEARGGMLGVIFMSVTFTLTSFTCTFAFVGLLLAMAAKGEMYWPVIGLLTFSTAFALPFFFLALFPSVLQKLPKSGGWMNTVKVTMGLIELGAAIKFLSVADLAWNPAPVVFDYTLVMTIWLVLSACIGFYLLGVFRLPHDTPVESISVPRLGFAMGFLGLAMFLAVGMFAPEKPGGKVWPQIHAFATPRLEGGTDLDLGPFIRHDGLKYALDLERAIPIAENRGQPLFVDFTGVNCANCRQMEATVWTRPEIRDLLEEFIGVQLYTDNVPTVQDGDLVAQLLQKNRELQQNWFGDTSLPGYAVVSPDGKQILARYIGMEQRDGEFAEFLKQGLANWKQHQARTPAPQVARR